MTMGAKAGRATLLGSMLCLASCAVPHVLMVPPVAFQAESGNGRLGCFSGQQGKEAWWPRATEATVHIKAHGARDTSGTGFVVRGSAVAGGGRNRILTAGHVGDGVLAKGILLEVSTSSGEPLGYADVVARARERIIARGGRGIRSGDMAVLEMRGFFDGGKAVFDRIEGLDLSPARPSDSQAGMFTDPAGVVGGTSGAPALDAYGRATAVVTAALSTSKDTDGDSMWQALKDVDVGSAIWLDDWIAKPGNHRVVRLPTKSEAFAEPIRDDAVLSALGTAGVSGANAQDAGPVSIVGYPSEACVVYRGTLARVSR